MSGYWGNLSSSGSGFSFSPVQNSVPFSLFIRFKFNSVGGNEGYMVALAGLSVATKFIRIGMDNSPAVVVFSFFGSSLTFASTSNLAVDGEWSTIMFVSTPNSKLLRLNNDIAGQYTNSYSYTIPTLDSLSVGCLKYYNGTVNTWSSESVNYISEVCIWNNYQLTNTDMTILHSGVGAELIEQQNIVAHMPLVGYGNSLSTYIYDRYSGVSDSSNAMPLQKKESQIVRRGIYQG